ncbi:MAG: hypothetical protein WC438_01855 [Candidatus Pacearchaeota archaeon]
MKKSVRRKIKYKPNFDIKRTLPFRLLIIFLIILLVLIIIKIGLNENKKESGLKGELGTLKWDLSKEIVILEVLNYNVSDNNQTIQVNMNWSSGNIPAGDLDSIFIKFIRSGQDCNYTSNNVLSYGINQTLDISYTSAACNPDFQNITNVEAYAQVNLHAKQLTPLEEIRLYKDESLINVKNLSESFFCLGNLSFNFTESPSNDMITMVINETNDLVTFYPIFGWYGSQRFNLTSIVCHGLDESAENIETNSNTSFIFTFLNETKPIPDTNHDPDFISANCSYFTIDVNKTRNMVIYMKDCFKDDDGDSLIYRYTNFSGSDSTRNISISVSGNNLTLTPKAGYIGNSSFYIYANDSVEETSGKINIQVINGSGIVTPAPSSTPKIIVSNIPGTETYSFPGQGTTFTITAENYETIEWFLNGVLKKSNSNFFNPGNLSEGNYTVRVDVKQGNQLDSKTWKLIVEDNERGTLSMFDTGQVIFYMIVIVLIIIIMLIVWLFILEKNRQGIDEFGFGSSSVNVVGKSTPSSAFNIPS